MVSADREPREEGDERGLEAQRAGAEADELRSGLGEALVLGLREAALRADRDREGTHVRGRALGEGCTLRRDENGSRDDGERVRELDRAVDRRDARAAALLHGLSGDANEAVILGGERADVRLLRALGGEEDERQRAALRALLDRPLDARRLRSREGDGDGGARARGPPPPGAGPRRRGPPRPDRPAPDAP